MNGTYPLLPCLAYYLAQALLLPPDRLPAASRSVEFEAVLELTLQIIKKENEKGNKKAPLSTSVHVFGLFILV
jgi:hypothetical protein